MSHSGYYEIVGSTVNRTGLKMNVIAGNILFNRLQDVYKRQGNDEPLE